jgi:hypothetical protein
MAGGENHQAKHRALDHGEMRTDADVYAGELLGADGKKLSGRPRISQTEAVATRA